jgi:hypothetical protein
MRPNPRWAERGAELAEAAGRGRRELAWPGEGGATILGHQHRKFIGSLACLIRAG